MWGRITISSIMVVSGSPAYAADARSGLLQVFDYNPIIAAERDLAKAAEIEVDIAKADRRFDFRIDATVERRSVDIGAGFSSTTLVAGSGTISLPVYSGGRITATISAARARAQVARAELDKVTNQVLSDAMTAHLATARDRTMLRLQQEQTHILEENLRAAEARAAAHELTMTDVEQARARLFISRANVKEAEAQMVSSSQRYWSLIGSAPDGTEQIDDTLPPLPPLSDVPRLLPFSPSMIAEQQRVRAALADVHRARAEGRPSVSIFASFERRFSGQDRDGYADHHNIAVGFRLRLPLYQGGRVAAEVRTKQALLSQSQEQQVAVERDMMAQIRSHYARLMATDEIVKQNRAAVESNKQALKLVTEQHLYGERTALEVLNASAELLDSETRYVAARRSRIASAYQILQLLGRLAPAVEGWRTAREPNADLRASAASKRPIVDATGLWLAPGLEQWRLRGNKV